MDASARPVRVSASAVGTSSNRIDVDGSEQAANPAALAAFAGLHTRGKHYVARADNIRRYTDGRFDPAGLDEHPDPLDEAMPPREVRLGLADAAPTGKVALLLHLDDLHPESLPLGGAEVARVGGLVAHAESASDMVRAADGEALADALARAGEHLGCPAGSVGDGWAGDLPVVTA